MLYLEWKSNSNDEGAEQMSELSTTTLTPPVGKRDHVQGPSTAAVTLVEYGDYQCPFCGDTYPIVKRLQKHFGDQLRVAFRNFPLSRIHAYAQRAAEAAEAAGAQGKFWEMHDWLYENQDKWSDKDNALELFTAEAQTLGLDTAKFKDDIVINKFLDQMNGERNDGIAAGVDSTPTFFLNNKIHVGVFAYNDLKAAIDNELKTAK